MREQVETLKHHANTFTQAVEVGFWIMHRKTVHHHFTAVRLFQRVQAAQKGTFAGAGWANHANHFLRSNIAGDTAQDVSFAKFFL
ncbi:hypothetical protein HMPREF0201_04512 [Cedecea davisae DSM 4568]|uniref:Uncharacterized protein n=1 Tax=Cedecea davisae DSM 4568 TaxID=566551 RepID=S3JI85_9ENTR|nr:hypothetical protein HMPREF0201_04512 [Cedecea davisae DSM 4568]